jgi:hypothetical protein
MVVVVVLIAIDCFCPPTGSVKLPSGEDLNEWLAANSEFPNDKSG